MAEDAWDEDVEAWQEWLEGQDSARKVNQNALDTLGLLSDMTYGGQLREFLPGAGRLYSQAASCFDRYS